MEKTKNQVELSDDIKTKLSEAVEIWAEDNLIGKPAILANMMFMGLEKKMIEEIKKINETFP